MYLDSRRRSYLRPVEPSDAAVIHGLRTNPEIGQHLGGAAPNEAAQHHWIERYRAREEAGQEYYFMIMHGDQTMGTVRVYDFRHDPTTGREAFCWGSWILDPQRPSGLAVYSCLISFGFGFDVLGFDSAFFDVRLANTRADKFYRFMGADETGVDDLNRYYDYSRTALEALKERSGPAIADHSSLSESS